MRTVAPLARAVAAVATAVAVVVVVVATMPHAVAAVDCKFDKQELIIGGLFPLTGHATGDQRAAAARVAVDYVNNDTTLLPCYTVRLLLNDTEARVERVFELMLDHSLVVRDTIGEIGPSSSDRSQTASTLGNVLALPLISYSATSPVLSDTVSYPAFGRTAPSDSLQGEVLVNLLRTFGWQEFTSIYESNIYGTAGNAALVNEVDRINALDLDSDGRSEADSSSRTINVRAQHVLPSELLNDDDGGDEALDAVLASVTRSYDATPGKVHRVILLFANSDMSTALMRRASISGMTAANGYLWVAADATVSDTWLGDDDVNSDGAGDELPDVVDAMDLMLAMRPKGGQGEMYESFLDLWETLDPNEYPGAGDRDVNFFATFAYDCVLLYAHAAHAVLPERGLRRQEQVRERLCRSDNTSLPTSDSNLESVSDYGCVSDITESRLMHAMRNADFTGLTGRVRLSEKHDRVTTYEIVQFHSSGRRSAAANGVPMPSEFVFVGEGVPRAIVEVDETENSSSISSISGIVDVGDDDDDDDDDDDTNTTTTNNNNSNSNNTTTTNTTTTTTTSSSSSSKRDTLVAIADFSRITFDPNTPVLFFDRNGAETTTVPIVSRFVPVALWSCDENREIIDVSAQSMYNETHIPLSFVCDSYIDCASRTSDEGFSCSPSWSGATVAFAVINSVVIAAFIVLGGLIHHFRDTKVVKATSPLFMYIILLGASITLASTFVWVDRPNDVTCVLRPWLSAIGILVMLASLYVKTWRIRQIFASRKSFSHVRVSDKMLLIAMLAILSPMLLLLTLWTAIDRPRAEHEEVRLLPQGVPASEVAQSTFYHTVCSDGDLGWVIAYFVYMGLVLIAGCWLAFQVRAVHSVYNESRQIMLSIYTIALLAVIVVPVHFVLDEEDPLAAFVFRSLAILLATLVTVALIFVPKVRLLLTGKGDTVTAGAGTASLRSDIVDASGRSVSSKRG